MSEIQSKTKQGANVTSAKKPAKATIKASEKKTVPVSAKVKEKNKISTPKINMDQYRQMVSEAAYYRAEKRQFIGGDPSEDWSIAEIEIKQLLHMQ